MYFLGIRPKARRHLQILIVVRWIGLGVASNGQTDIFLSGYDKIDAAVTSIKLSRAYRGRGDCRIGTAGFRGGCVMRWGLPPDTVPIRCYMYDRGLRCPKHGNVSLLLENAMP